VLAFFAKVKWECCALLGLCHFAFNVKDTENEFGVGGGFALVGQNASRQSSTNF